MLSPRKPRSRKVQKGRQRGQVQSYNFVFGRYAIQVTKAGQISARLLETCRRTLSRTFQRRGKIVLRVFPDIPVTKKPSEVRMGKGKGSLDHWVVNVQAGQILFEFDGVPLAVATQAAAAVRQKMGLPVQFITRSM